MTRKSYIVRRVSGVPISCHRPIYCVCFTYGVQKENINLKAYTFCLKYDQKVDTNDFIHVIFLMCTFTIACALLMKLVFLINNHCLYI
jgi:hypothetical protein